MIKACAPPNACVRVDANTIMIEEKDTPPLDDGVILPDEIVLMGYAFINPSRPDPTMDSFSREQYGLASDVLQYTSAVDEQIGIIVIDDETTQEVPRHVLATYKMLMYNTVCEAHRAKQKAAFYRGLTVVLAVGLVGVTLAANTANFLEAVQAFVDVLKR